MLKTRAFKGVAKNLVKPFLKKKLVKNDFYKPQKSQDVLQGIF